MWRKLLLVCIFGTCAGMVSRPAPAAPAAPAAHAASSGTASTIEDPRIALVIGNASYQDDPLPNPVNDARAIGAALQLRGFEVMLLQNLTRERMTQALHRFRQRLDRGGSAVVYFAGHGLQLAGKTMLAPIDSDSRMPASLINKGVDLQEVLDVMAEPRPGKQNLVILDICLNNPFGTGNPAAMIAPDRTLIAFGTRPGALASDGVTHGLYTAALLDAMSNANADLRAVVQAAGTRVRQASAGRQLPWSISSPRLPPAPAIEHNIARTIGPLALIAAGDELDAAGKNAAPVAHSRAILPKDSAEQYELTFWDSIKDSNHISDFEAYLQAYPNGRFAALAKGRIERLRAASRKSETPKEEARTPAPAAAPPATPAAKQRSEKQSPAAPPKPAPEHAAPAPATAPAAPTTESHPAPAAAGETKDCPACPAMITLRTGSFTMGTNAGDPSEKPAHHVTIGTPFAIGKTEVTVEQWNACVEAGGCAALSSEANGAKNLPARDVSWEDAQSYVKWLAKTTGKAYRLPSEAEWEYAARGGTSTRYWWGEQMKPGNANCKECGSPWEQKKPAPVASFAANPYGLHDVNGSVWEWVADCWHTSYKGAPADGHAWDTPNCRERVIRGGSWREGASYMPSTTRFKYAASVRDAQNGFRVVREMK